MNMLPYMVKGTKVADGTKIANQLKIEYSELYRWAQYNHSFL